MPGHAFISYVREDSAVIDRIQRILNGMGIPVWRDRDALWPGEDWKSKIRQAITDDALAFIVCFSAASEARLVSGQNEELVLAIEQLRQRRPDRPWLIPVRLDEVAIPDYEIGGGRTLRSIQWVDLIGDGWDEGIGRLVRSVQQILAGAHTPTAASPAPLGATDHLDRLKAALRAPSSDIELHDILMVDADRVYGLLSDDARFPARSESLAGDHAAAALWLADLVDQQMAALDAFINDLVVVSAWARPEHLTTISRAVERVLAARRDEAGSVALLELRWFPGSVLLYSAGLAALQNKNFAAVEAVATARTRDIHGTAPLAARSPWRAFSNFELPAHVLAYRLDPDAHVDHSFVNQLAAGRIGKRHTPVSDFLHARLRDYMRPLVVDTTDYDDLFDRWEVLLGVVMTDLRLQAKTSDSYPDYPIFGRFTWRDRFSRDDSRLEVRIRHEAVEAGDDWPWLRAGFFGRSSERAISAFNDFIEGARGVRRQRF